MITITTSNLNGIRAAERKGMLDWSDAHTPDVWCMQEVRAPQDALDYQFATPEIAESARGFVIDRAESYDARWSDHAPLSIRYDV